MQKTYTETFRITSTMTDLSNQWKPSSILEKMQDVATMHADILNVGRSDLIQKNIVWVLTRVEVEIDRYPNCNDTVSLQTFPMAHRRWFFPRYFIFRDAEGKEFGRASTLWVLLDFTTRQLTKLEDMPAMPDNSDMTAPMGFPAPVARLAVEPVSSLLTPQYSDVDVNLHVNNTKYLDWCCNALGIETMKTHCMSHFMLNYDKEVRPDQQMNIDLRRLGDDFAFSGSFEGKRHFDVGGTLSLRDPHKALNQ
ncbi:MAG: hypothetical protein E7333_06715 [Clostridiales bacterium]|nr:hypothetical protein [Clostridiales bacterium]